MNEGRWESHRRGGTVGKEGRKVIFRQEVNVINLITKFMGIIWRGISWELIENKNLK
jgi:hypothetical protein